jgi:ribonuclease R
MEINSLGEILHYRIEQSIIRSKRRFTYEEVERVLAGEDSTYAKDLHTLQVLTHVLRTRRQEMGSIDFDTSERVLVLDEEGIPREIRPAERLESQRLVAECMLAANRTVATHVQDRMSGKKRSFVYRVHETPDPDRVEALVALLQKLGIPYRIEGKVQSEDYRNILDIIGNLEFRHLVEQIAFQSMTKAVYTTENRGHFGLGFSAYTHFTSPIRRYPDLIVHRLLKSYLFGMKADAPKKTDELEKLCEHCNDRERRATAAERDYTKLKSLEFLSRKVGHMYEGVISGIASFGIFVELSRYMTEGLVRPAQMGKDNFEFDAENYQFVAENSDVRYRLGDRVKVRVDRVSVAERTADFSLT